MVFYTSPVVPPYGPPKIITMPSVIPGSVGDRACVLLRCALAFLADLAIPTLPRFPDTASRSRSRSVTNPHHRLVRALPFSIWMEPAASGVRLGCRFCPFAFGLGVNNKATPKQNAVSTLWALQKLIREEIEKINPNKANLSRWQAEFQRYSAQLAEIEIAAYVRKYKMK